MKTQPPSVARTSFCLLVATVFTALAPMQARANPNIRAAFFSFYSNAVGTRLDNLPSRAGHCGVCHYDFKNGGSPWNPYGQAIRDIGGLNSAAGRSNAVWTVRNLDPEGDGYSAQTEITDLTYGNTPSFPGLSAANLGQVLNIPQTEIQTNLTPAITIDTTPPLVAVLSPNGGETVVANRVFTVTWTASDASGIAAIHIYESLDNGTTFSPVALGLPNTGSYSWVPPDRPASMARLRVVAVDGAANRTNDVSNAPFAIVSPPGGRVPTTLRDFDLPGTQPFEGGPDLAAPESCASCHGGYNAAVEPYRNWQGSMMAHASRDPLFLANLAIANQDAPNSGDLCLRCHMARGWLAGRSVPSDGSRLQPADLAGVSCDLCHRMVDPVYVPNTSPVVDATILAALSFPGTNYGSGMYVIDPSSIQRGPVTNPAAPHSFTVSSFHRTGAFCGTCHDVSNPAFTADGLGHYPPNALDASATSFSPQTMAPVERTYSEWLHSEYNTLSGVFAPALAGNKPGGRVSACQDCHMRDVTGVAANPTNNPSAPVRTDLPLHDLTGGSTWLPGLLTNLYPAEVNASAIQAGVIRATYLLQSAANLGLADDGGQLKVTVTNQSGHKLPTGYPEGRRIWVNVRFYDDALNLLAESGAYNPTNGVLTRDPAAKVYETHPGIDTNISALVGLPDGPSLHFVLNNRIYEDNRIPPRGFTNAVFAAFGGAPAGHS
ncbi:MAG TPA: Ig-like domain-containing protein, partial [Methylomirabilota bacterium]|nr:Ig-like domain-containing protein [Methylomirabilota bacterium]